MRSIQYEKTEEKTKGDTARKRRGIKESNKVGAKNCVFVLRHGEMEERIQGRREG